MAKILLLVMMCSLLTGCTFYKYTAISTVGNKLNVQWGLRSIKGDKVDLKFERTVCIGKDCVYDKSIQDTKNKNAVDSIE